VHILSYHYGCVDHVSSFKRLRGGVVFVSQIPKTETGKILRRELRAKSITSASKLWKVRSHSGCVVLVAVVSIL